jgi:hypothetical protein
MDIGFFKASAGRLWAWMVLPPLLISIFGLGSYGWLQQAHWKLEQTTALADVLPDFVIGRKAANEMLETLTKTSVGEIGSEDQLISFLQDVAQQCDFMVDSVDMVANNRMQEKKVLPVLNAVVRGTGDFNAIQIYINEVKMQQRLLSLDSIRLKIPKKAAEDLYDAELVFELLLLDDLQMVAGGVK